MTGRHLLTAADLPADRLRRLLAAADRHTAGQQTAPVAAGRTVALAFFEPSTRTRLSFEQAARRLGADVLTFDPATSSMSKGESLRDTVETLALLGADLLVLRHPTAGAAGDAARWLDALTGGRVPVVNAGDGAREHPTQALGDVHTFTSHRAEQGSGGGDWFDLTGVHVGVVGDVAHSRVARSTNVVWTALGAQVLLVGPPALLPGDMADWRYAATATSFDDVLGTLDVVYLLRQQRERGDSRRFGDERQYRADWHLTVERADRMRPGAVVMHPGPVNRDVEVDRDVLDRSNPPVMLLGRQVTHGVAARAAVLEWLLDVEPDERAAR